MSPVGLRGGCNGGRHVAYRAHPRRPPSLAFGRQETGHGLGPEVTVCLSVAFRAGFLMEHPLRRVETSLDHARECQDEVGGPAWSSEESLKEGAWSVRPVRGGEKES